ncbi:25S rRNA (uracil2843-N3)-methyltransferase, partial [Phenoliferia sp. Uapishka_3]
MVQDNRTFDKGAEPHMAALREPRIHHATKKATGAANPLSLITQSERSLLSLLSSLSAPTIADSKFTLHLQALKTALYNKEYEQAFGGEDDLFRKVYSVRWVPSRALVYRKVFVEMKLRDLLKNGGEVVFLGGGAGSEVLALGSLLSSPTVTTAPVKITTYDFADWSSVLNSQVAALSAATPTLNLTLNPIKHDILSFPLPSFPTLPTLITLLFTASELFLQSRASTVQLLAHLTTTAPSGTHLLVVESAALALVPIGKDGRTYPMETLLDHALGKTWEIIQEEDKKWYRMPEGAADCYPLKLENTRVLLRLYKKA